MAAVEHSSHAPSEAAAVDQHRITTNSLDADPHSDSYFEYHSDGKGLSSRASIGHDGRISVQLDLKEQLPDLPDDLSSDVIEFATDETSWRNVPQMSIVIMIVGSRGDVQPYVAIGKALVKDGHRVRVATHETFESFVTENGLEFFNIGGNPQELMSYMVKNPGLIPGMHSMATGDIGRKRKMLAEMMNGCWLSCISPDAKTGASFAADAIISNPPTFAHIHCAEALGIPLLMSFTMPWSATKRFPHPLVNIQASNAEKGLSNYLSYALAENLTWQGTGDLVNKFRMKRLGVAPLSLRNGPGVVDRVRVPWTYCMSPALIPKPKDWKQHIDVVGFYFLDLAVNYKPPEELAEFLSAGPTPIYIGFGSVVIDDPAGMTKMIFEATERAGVRALVSSGWAGLGKGEVPPHVFILGNVPHDWLFAENRVSAVIHHGGAGTTAIGLANGRPTLVVPFFGDQLFWGTMIQKAGVGPHPIPHKKLTAANLYEAIVFLLSPIAQSAAHEMASKIHAEDGVAKGVESFYSHLPLLNMRCDLDPTRLAIWWSKQYCLKLSSFSAQVLADAKLLDMASLEIHRSKEYATCTNITDPLKGGVNAMFWSCTNYYNGMTRAFEAPVKGIVKGSVATARGYNTMVASISKGFRNAGKGKSSTNGSGKGMQNFIQDCQAAVTTTSNEFMGAMHTANKAGKHWYDVTVKSMRPAAEVMGRATKPIWKSMQNNFTPSRDMEHHQRLRDLRLAEGVAAVGRSTEDERVKILDTFKSAMDGTLTKERRKTMVFLHEQSAIEDHDQETMSLLHDFKNGSDGKGSYVPM